MRDEENTLIGFSDMRRICVVNVTWLMLCNISSYKLCKDKTNGHVSIFNLCGLRTEETTSLIIFQQALICMRKKSKTNSCCRHNIYKSQGSPQKLIQHSNKWENTQSNTVNIPRDQTHCNDQRCRPLCWCVLNGWKACRVDECLWSGLIHRPLH